MSAVGEFPVPARLVEWRVPRPTPRHSLETAIAIVALRLPYIPLRQEGVGVRGCGRRQRKEAELDPVQTGENWFELLSRSVDGRSQCVRNCGSVAQCYLRANVVCGEIEV